MNILDRLKDLERLSILIHKQLTANDLDSAHTSSRNFNKESRRLEYRKQGLKKLPEMDEVKHLKALVTSARYDNQKVQELIEFFVKLNQGKISRGEALPYRKKREVLPSNPPTDLGRYQKNFHHMIDLSLLTIEAIKQSITAYNEEPWYNHELLSSGRYIKIVENIYHKKGFYTDVKEDLIKNIFENVDWDGITINDFKIKSLGGKVQNCIFNNVQILHFSLEDGKCVKCNFLNSKIKGMHDHFNFISCSFSNQCSILYINRVHFKNCDFDNCRFDNHNSTYNFKDNSTITNCSFHCGFIKVDQSTVMDCGLTDVQIELSGSKINKSHFKESRLNFQGTWLVPSWYSGCIIEGSRIGLLNPPSFVKCSFPETSIGSGGNTFDISNFDNCDFKEAIYGATITPEDLVLLKNWVYIKDVPNGVLARLDLKDLMKYRKFNKIKGGDLSLLGDGLEGALSKAEPELKKPTAKPKRKSLWERIRRKKSK